VAERYAAMVTQHHHPHVGILGRCQILQDKNKKWQYIEVSRMKAGQAIKELTAAKPALPASAAKATTCMTMGQLHS
jgi:hypothetical protein